MTNDKKKEKHDEHILDGKHDEPPENGNLHSGHHHHGPDLNDTSGSRLLFTLALNFFIPVAQVIGGLLANSVALISDAVHNFSDFTAVLISYIAFRIGRKGATVANTFGYRRAEIMAALINVMLLAGASAVILYHAVHRFLHPQAVNGLVVIILAGVGVVGNGLSAWLLHRGSANSLNMRGAFLHMVGDLLTSVVVLINGILLMFVPWYWLDPLLSVLIVAFIMKTGWGLLKESTAILMNATPGHIKLEDVRAFLADLPGILDVHYLHAWQVSSSSTAFSCHVVVPDQLVSRTAQLTESIRYELLHRFRIDHPVLQFETTDCGHGSLLCEMSCAEPSQQRSKDKVYDQRTLPTRDQFLYHTARVILGFIFLAACYDKILHPQEFATVIYNYQLLPGELVNIAAIVLPWVELLLGLSLVMNLWIPGAAVLGNLFLLLFFSVLLFNMARGLDVSCGCFSTAPGEKGSNYVTVLRDLSFLVVSGYLFYAVFFTAPPKANSKGKPSN